MCSGQSEISTVGPVRDVKSFTVTVVRFSDHWVIFAPVKIIIYYEPLLMLFYLEGWREWWRWLVWLRGGLMGWLRGVDVVVERGVGVVVERGVGVVVERGVGGVVERGVGVVGLGLSHSYHLNNKRTVFIILLCL